MSRADEIDKRITAIYNDCWKAYREYTKSHDMGKFNSRIIELKGKHEDAPFLINVLCAFAPVVNSLHAEYLMEHNQQRGRGKKL